MLLACEPTLNMQERPMDRSQCPICCLQREWSIATIISKWCSRIVEWYQVRFRKRKPAKSTLRNIFPKVVRAGIKTKSKWLLNRSRPLVLITSFQFKTLVQLSKLSKDTRWIKHQKLCLAQDTIALWLTKISMEQLLATEWPLCLALKKGAHSKIYSKQVFSDPRMSLNS